MKKTFGLILFILISFHNIFADDARGFVDPILGGFRIQNSDSIEMTEEVVEIWESHVKVTFWFTNLEDKEQNVTIGFPVEDFKYRYYNEIYGYECLPLQDDKDTRNKIIEYYNFKSTCNGESLNRKLVASAHVKDDVYDNDLYDFWFTTELNFKPNETLVVVDEYDCGRNFGYDSIMWNWNYYGYILTTGSTWANSIKKATIIFHTKEENITWDNIAVVKKHDPNESYSVNSYLSYTSNEQKYTWNMDDMSYIWNTCTYMPSKIEKYKDETIVTWILEDIEPKDDWVLGCYKANRFGPFWSFNYVKFLGEDLMKIPEYAELCGFKSWLLPDGPWEDCYEVSSTETYESFQNDIKTMYKAGFTDSQKKTKVAEVIAQFIINAIYAGHGYEFNNQKWTDVFNNYDWYRSLQKSKKVSQKDFTKEEVEIIQNLQRYTRKNDYIAKYSDITKWEGVTQDKKIAESGKYITEIKILSKEEDKITAHVYRTMTPFSQVLDFDVELKLKGKKYVFDCCDNFENRVAGWMTYDKESAEFYMKCKKISSEGKNYGRLYDDIPLKLARTDDDINFIIQALKY